MSQFAFDHVPRKPARSFPWWALLAGCALVAGLILVVSLMMKSPGAGGGGLRDDGLVIELVEIEKEGGIATIKFSVLNPSETKTVKSFQSLREPMLVSYFKVLDDLGNSCVLEESYPSPLFTQGVAAIAPKQTATLIFQMMIPDKPAKEVSIELGPVLNGSSTSRRYSAKIKHIEEHKGVIYKNQNPQVKVEVKDESLGIPGHVQEGKKPTPIPVKINKDNPGFFQTNHFISLDPQIKSRDGKIASYKVYEIMVDANQGYFIEMRSSDCTPRIVLLEGGREVATTDGEQLGKILEKRATITYTSPHRSKHLIVATGYRDDGRALAGGFSIFVRLHDEE